MFRRLRLPLFCFILLLVAAVTSVSADRLNVTKPEAAENPPCVIHLFDNTEDTFYSDPITDGVDVLLRRTQIVEETEVHDFVRYDFFTGHLIPLAGVIPDTAQNIRLDDGRILWLDGGKLVVHHLKTGQTRLPLPNAPIIADNYQIVGTQVVWSMSDGTDTEIYLYNLANGELHQVTDNALEDGGFSFNGAYVVWTQNDGTDSDILLYDVAANASRTLTSNAVDDTLMGLSGNTVVWQRGMQVVVYNAPAQTTTEFRGDSPTYGQPDQYHGIAFSGRYLLLSGVQYLSDDSAHYWLLFYDIATDQLSEWRTEAKEPGAEAISYYPQVAGAYGLLQRFGWEKGGDASLYHIPTKESHIVSESGFPQFTLTPFGILTEVPYSDTIYYTDNHSLSEMGLLDEAATFNHNVQIAGRVVVWDRADFNHQVIGLGAAICSGPPTRELLANGSFEANLDVTPKLPDDWTVAGKPKTSRLRTDLPGAFIAYSPPNAFMFKGSSSKRVTLKQIVDLSHESFSTGETLTFSAMVNQKNGLPGALIGKAIVKYAGGGKDVLKLHLPNPKIKGYTAISDQITLTNANIAKIKVTLFYKAGVGKFFVDDVRLTQTPATTLPLPSDWLPLPSAP